MSEKQPLNRREFLERAAILGAVALGGSALLAACESQDASDGQAPATGTAETAEASGGGDFSCDDAAAREGLSDAQMQTRTVNEYVDDTPNPEQRCDNCALYTEPEAGNDCGGCAVVAGPIHPAGWCKVWVPA